MNKFIIIFFFLTFTNLYLFAQQIPYEKIPVELRVKGIGQLDINVISKDSAIFLPCSTFLDYLGIKHNVDTTNQEIKGFFKKPSNKFAINLLKFKAFVGDSNIVVKNKDFLLDYNNYYLQLDLLNRLFKLNAKYNFKNLAVEIPLLSDLPKVEYVRRQGRKNQSESVGRKMPEADSIISAGNNILEGGSFGWNVSRRVSRLRSPTSQYNFTFGNRIAGGDFTANYSGFKNPRHTKSQFRAQYRYPLFDQEYVSQITIGDLYAKGVTNYSIRGIEVTNRPIQYRNLFGFDDIEGEFSPNVDVEVSGLNFNRLFLKTDSTGKYQSQIPIYYGRGKLNVQSYDEWGISGNENYRYNIPISLISKGKTEYSFVLGQLIQLKKKIAFSSLIKTGLSSNLTIGLNVDYLNMSGVSQKIIPSLLSIARVSPGMIVDFATSPNYVSKAKLHWIFPNDAEFISTFDYYNENKYLNPAKTKYRAEVSSIIPLRQNLGIQFNISQISYKITDYRGFNATLYTSLKSISAKISSLWYWQQFMNTNSLIYRRSTLDFSVTLPLGVAVNLNTSYDHKIRQLEEVGIYISKTLFNKLNLSLAHHRIQDSKYSYTFFNVGYVFPFSRILAGMNLWGENYREYHTRVDGMLNYSIKPFGLSFDNQRGNFNYGGIDINPYVDENLNGMYDSGEERIKAGSVLFRNYTRASIVSNTSIVSNRLSHLYPYEDYEISVDPFSLENPTLVPIYRNYKVTIEPNTLRRIDVPLIVGGAIRGKVYFKENLTPVEGVEISLKKINGNNDNSGKSYSTITFSTGEYEFSPVAPGKYNIELNNTQVSSLGYKAQPASINIEVHALEEGDLIEGKDFNLVPK